MDNPDVRYIKFKNGECMMATVKHEDDYNLTIFAAMNAEIVERNEYSGLVLVPSIPFGIDYVFNINKYDILYQVPPPDALLELYSIRVSYSVDALIEHMIERQKQKTEKLKNLN